MRILVVLTGGTIGSSIVNGVADVNCAMGKYLLDLYGYNDAGSVVFECVSPINILSENSTPHTLAQICSFMLSVRYENYDGVIVTHGSDTLNYTSALLGMALSWVEIPIVVTAADYVLELPYSNGLNNFRASVDFIKCFHMGLHSNCGVFTVWQNPGEEAKVYISTRLNEADGYNDFFTSWGGTAFGTVVNGIFKRIDNSINPEQTKNNSVLSYLKNQNLSFENNVLLLHSYPGLDFNAFSLHGKRAVLLNMYHSATVCIEGDDTSFLKFIEKCNENKISVFVCSAKLSQYTYKTSRKMLDKNVISLYNIGICTAYTKILLSYGIGADIMKYNLFYESLPCKV